MKDELLAYATTMKLYGDSNEEIRTYADTVTTTGGDRMVYPRSNMDKIIQRLTEWRDRYNQ